MTTASASRTAKKEWFIGKTTTLHEQHTFLYISLSLLHDYNVKLCSFTFYGERERKTTILFFFFWHEPRYSHLELIPEKFPNL